MLERHLSVKQAAATTGFSIASIRKAIHDGQVSVVRTSDAPNAAAKIPESSLTAWVASRTTRAERMPAPAPPARIVSRPLRPRAQRDSLDALLPDGFQRVF